ncbi:uncharacterized protein M421DRAFT_376078 [Didymella exigua CBS 183.55]|uniref:Mid2 domain-containing protein n=1 Tax=Didymella exigua CBS 183.55 TaxID=1150837 RepID=A0A6A5RTN6_9PLEO|nr:uncharacterized protein M421DRAFT_376078 [Didymella exigua CBS 183.55]KAF1930524.1 hypothetical protein M421DRAFT_376078 [Didymella exigua CBS 183.55]
MSGRLHKIIASASALLQLSNAKLADPTITAPAVLPRQNSDAFIGYLELSNTWTSISCNSGLTWYQSGQYAQCCPETETHCYAPTACVGGSQIYTYPDSSSVRTIACTENYQNAAISICNTIFIFENTHDSNPRTNINCGDSSANWSYYRDVPLEATATTSSIPGATTSTPALPTQASEPEPGSKAWIAGVVIGPILGLALVGAGVWFFLRRKRKAVQLPQHSSGAHIDSDSPPAGVEGYTEARPQSYPAQPTHYNLPGQSGQYRYPQQGGFSPVPQYGFQSAYNATADPQPEAYTHNTKREGIGGTAELAGNDTGIARTAPSPLVAVPVSELSGVDARRLGQEEFDSNKPQ